MSGEFSVCVCVRFVRKLLTNLVVHCELFTSRFQTNKKTTLSTLLNYIKHRTIEINLIFGALVKLYNIVYIVCTLSPLSLSFSEIEIGCI